MSHGEVLTLLGALSPETLFSTPRLLVWIDDLASAVMTWVRLERYADSNKEKAGKLKGQSAVMRQLKPNAIRSFEVEEKTEKQLSVLLPDLPEIPKPPHLPKLPKIK